MEAFVREGFGDTLGMGPTGPQVGVEVNPNLWSEIAPERAEHLVLMSSLLGPSEMPIYQELRQRLTKKSCVVTNDTLGALREKVGLDVYVESVKGKFYRPSTFNPTPVVVKLHRSVPTNWWKRQVLGHHFPDPATGAPSKHALSGRKKTATRDKSVTMMSFLNLIRGPDEVDRRNKRARDASAASEEVDREGSGSEESPPIRRRSGGRRKVRTLDSEEEEEEREETEREEGSPVPPVVRLRIRPVDSDSEGERGTTPAAQRGGGGTEELSESEGEGGEGSSRRRSTRLRREKDGTARVPMQDATGKEWEEEEEEEQEEQEEQDQDVKKTRRVYRSPRYSTDTHTCTRPYCAHCTSFALALECVVCTGIDGTIVLPSTGTPGKTLGLS